MLLSAVILVEHDREWFHRDISFVYALFASVWLVITGVLIVLFAGIIGGWLFDLVPPLRWLADRMERRSARLLLGLAVLIGVAVIVAALWFLKDVPMEPYDNF